MLLRENCKLQRKRVSESSVVPERGELTNRRPERNDKDKREESRSAM